MTTVCLLGNKNFTGSILVTQALPLSRNATLSKANWQPGALPSRKDSSTKSSERLIRVEPALRQVQGEDSECCDRRLVENRSFTHKISLRRVSELWVRTEPTAAACLIRSSLAAIHHPGLQCQTLSIPRSSKKDQDHQQERWTPRKARERWHRIEAQRAVRAADPTLLQQMAVLAAAQAHTEMIWRKL